MAVWQSVGLISIGATLGAILRWCLGAVFNPMFVTFAFGTLIANYLGCFIIGVLTAFIWQFPQLSHEWRLFLITGFLGSLTTFSAFSAEVVEKLFHGQWTNGLEIVFLHLFGCIGFTFLGMICYKFFSS